MNNIASLMSFSSVRKSLNKREDEEQQSAVSSPQQKRATSIKRLPFSTIKSTKTSCDSNVEAELPPSPKLLDDNRFPVYLNTASHQIDISSSSHQINHAFVRCLKTSSFHTTYRRRTFRNEDNIAAFLEAFEDVAKRFNENKQNAIKAFESETSNNRLIDERYLNLTIEENKELTKAEKEALYCEIIYTIKHKIGRTIDGHNDYIQDLYKYAQEAFKMSQSDHDRLFAHTCEEKAPIIILNVEVIEARNLEAKDANGYSDPYCMLGIIPGNRAHTLMDSLSNLSLTGGGSGQSPMSQPLMFSSTSELGSDTTSIASGYESNSNIATATTTTAAGAGNLNRTQTVSYLNPGRHSTKASETSHKSAGSSLIKRFSSFRKSADKYAQQQQQQQQQLQQTPLPSPMPLQHLPTSSNLDKDSANQRLFASHKIVNALKDGKLPAKYIKTTDVKSKTLNPVWNERFRFQIDDIKHDTLHLDIWDHDDESSVFEAAKKLNEVKGLKGLDRYFKQIAQSARASASAIKCGDGSAPVTNVDDFLGSVNVPLDELASSGLDKWFDLEGHHSHAHVQGSHNNNTNYAKSAGKIRLRLKLATREDRGSVITNEEDNFNDFEQNERILEQFVRHELERRRLGKNSDWMSELGREAETILHQHAIQGDLTDFQIALCRWISYSRIHLEKEISYKVLFQKLELLDKIWSSSSPTRDETEKLRDSFEVFIKHCFKLISNIRDAFPITQDRKGLEKLEYVLKLLNKIFNMDAFKYCFPFQNSLLHELISVLKNSTLDWFDKMCDFHLRKAEEDMIKKLIEFIQIVYIDVLISFKFYKPIFEAELNISYFTIMYKKIDLKLIELVRKILSEEFGEDIKRYATDVVAAYSQPTGSHLSSNSPQNISTTPSSYSPNNGQSANDKTKKETNQTNQNQIFKYNTITEKISITLFELYTIVYSIYKFKNFINESERTSLKINSFHELFYMPYKRWVDLLKRKIESKVEKCFESEKTDVLTELTKFGSSSVEMCNCFTQVGAIWRLIDWPEFIGAQMFLIESVDSLCKAAHKYATQSKDNCQAFIAALAAATAAASAQQQQSSMTPTSQNPNSSNNSLFMNTAAPATNIGSTSNRTSSGGGTASTSGSRQALPTFNSPPTSSSDACQKLMIATNNLERVRESLKAFLIELDLERYHSQAEKIERTKLYEANKASFDAQINQASDYVVAIIEYILESIISNKIIPELDPHMFYLLESPESAKAQESISRIIEYMDTNLVFYKDFAFKINFNRLLHLLWDKLLVEIEMNLKKDDQCMLFFKRSNIFFAKMSECLEILVTFFNAENQGLSKDYLQSVERYKQLKKYLKLQTFDTAKLISLYYQEMVAIQNALKSSEYGSLTCRAYFHSKDDTLAVES